jgi:hypothetical protein
MIHKIIAVDRWLFTICIITLGSRAITLSICSVVKKNQWTEDNKKPFYENGF